MKESVKNLFEYFLEASERGPGLDTEFVIINSPKKKDTDTFSREIATIETTVIKHAEFISSNKYYKRFTKYSFLDDFEEQFYYIPFKYHIDLSLIKDPILIRIHLEYILEKLTKQYPKLKLELNPENEV